MRIPVLRQAFLTLLALLLAPPGLRAQSLADVVANVTDAVVVVYTESTEYDITGPAVAASVSGTGSGVVVSPNQVLTAAHVVQAADQVTVVFPDGTEMGARVVGSSETHDVALLQLDRISHVAPARLGDSNAARIGDEVFVVGAPLGESHTLTVGHLSARRLRSGLLANTSVEFLQTDASINPGNSGGPMFNMSGEVIGIVSHILSQSGGSVGLGYAVSVNTAREILIDEPSWWTGLSAYPISGALAAILNVPPPGAGLMVHGVAKGSVAERLGLRPALVPINIAGQQVKIGGDIIIEVQGMTLGGDIEYAEQIRRTLMALPPSSVVRVKVLRAGSIIELVATTPNR